MSSKNSFKIAVLAASIALAMGSTAVMAATAPTATQLPGVGTTTGPVTVGTITNGVQNINIAGNAVINWGKAGGTINATQPGGFNIGSQATLNFTGAGAPLNSGVLNVDSSGNPSQIFGTLTSDANTSVFVANTNGIIVGASAIINVAGVNGVNLIANDRGTINFDGTASPTSIEYEGTGGNVTVAKGASITGNVLVSGGGVVNVDLSAFKSGAATIQAGVKNSTSTLVNDNTAAVLTATGDFAGPATLASFASAGNASTSGKLGLGSNARVDGTLTNTGDLTLGTGFTIKGGLVNNKTATATAAASAGSLSNNGAFDAGNNRLTTTKGGLSNGGQMINVGGISVTGGDFANGGQLGTNGFSLNVTGGNVVNGGVITGSSQMNVTGGNVTNNGSMNIDNVYVVNGSIVNNGAMTLADYYVETASDSTLASFTKGADYSITNAGTITAAGRLNLSANSDRWGASSRTGAKNDSIGSVINTGKLQVGVGSGLLFQAYNDVNLAGTLQTKAGTTVKAISATNPLGYFTVYAGDYATLGGVTALNAAGVATVSTSVAATGGIFIAGNQVKLMSDISSVDGAGKPAGAVQIVAGAQSTSDYAVRVASGKTVSAGQILVDGDTAGDNPNLILQGTMSADQIVLGGGIAVSDVISGPTGSLVATGAAPLVVLGFTGRIKTAPYLNDPNNFRYNYLPISLTAAATQPLMLILSPVAYATNGTSNGLSAVNLLVNGDVNLIQGSFGAVAPTIINGVGSAVTGVSNVPNTHLVLQSTGNIATWGSYYWPGYVYLGNIASDAHGAALPGTLGLGTISLNGDFSNVLPGSLDNAGGMHFITQFPLVVGARVTTNANSWVNFGTDLMTDWAVAKQNGAGGPFFFGGTQGAGTVVNYGALDDSMFHTHAPVSAR